MRLTLDEFRCDGHGVCVEACPEVFALDDDDEVVRILVEEPDEALRAGVERAVDGCPKAALTIAV